MHGKWLVTLTKPAGSSGEPAVTKSYTLIIMHPCRGISAARNSEPLTDFELWKTVDYKVMNAVTSDRAPFDLA